VCACTEAVQGLATKDAPDAPQQHHSSLDANTATADIYTVAATINAPTTASSTDRAAKQSTGVAAAATTTTVSFHGLCCVSTAEAGDSVLAVRAAHTL
jgi:hypothetical protein